MELSPFWARFIPFLSPASGGPKLQKSRLRPNAAWAWFTLLGSQSSMYLRGNEPPPGQTRPRFPPWEMGTHWGENTELRPNAVGSRFTVMLPYSDDIYLQAPGFLSSDV